MLAAARTLRVAGGSLVRLRIEILVRLGRINARNRGCSPPGTASRDGGREPSGARQTPEGSPKGASGGEYQSRGSVGGRVRAGEMVYGPSPCDPTGNPIFNALSILILVRFGRIKARIPEFGEIVGTAFHAGGAAAPPDTCRCDRLASEPVEGPSVRQLGPLRR